jgi:AraC-like DNA-binding protein
MKIENYIPAPALSPYIKGYMIIESNQGMDSHILPETAMVMAFRISGYVHHFDAGIKSKLPVSVITGIRKSVRHLSYDKHTATLLVRFREGGIPAFFGEPFHELNGTSLSLDNLVAKSKLEAIEEQLAEAGSHSARIIVIEHFLLSLLKGRKHDFLVTEALEMLVQARGNITIHKLLENLPVSRDAFEKRFRKAIGTSPKHYASILRFRNLIDMYPQSKSLTEIAYAAGYFDQSHFIKDFKSYTGQAPNDFFRSATWW